MTFEELEELMQEPPGGENHGRVRTEGGWRDLEYSYEADLPYIVVDPEYGKGRRLRRSPEGIPHGTTGGYRNHRCRCDECRAAQREALRRYRTSRQPPEAEL